MIKEFRAFINRGNVIDLAVAVIIGAAFTAIVKSLVDDIVMPLIGIALGGVDFTALAFQVGAATITYGNFIQAIINFVLIALVVFFLVRSINRLQERMAQEKEEAEKVEETKPAAPPAPSAEEKLLTEIRDLLREQGNTNT
jgi:large conductance mechanosensitive channel